MCVQCKVYTDKVVESVKWRLISQVHMYALGTKSFAYTVISNVTYFDGTEKAFCLTDTS